jgi:hypothetical protein
MAEDELTKEELEKQDGEPLPERTQMSVLQPLPNAPGTIEIPTDPTIVPAGGELPAPGPAPVDS